MIEVIASGSTGNCVLYLNGRVMVDCGIPANQIISKTVNKIENLEVVVVTHKHGDHVGVGKPGAGFRAIQKAKPEVLFVGGPWMEELFIEMKIVNYAIMEMDRVYYFGDIIISPEEVVHNAPNMAVHIGILKKDGYLLKDRLFKIFHGTDLESYIGMIAKDYDIYALELNYDEATVQSYIDADIAAHKTSYRENSVINHVSIQEGKRWIKSQVTPGNDNYSVFPLHMSAVFIPIFLEKETKICRLHW